MIKNKLQALTNFVRNNVFMLGLVGFGLFFIAINVKLNLFTYNNFDFGKFDLGNMTQMVWNTLHGRVMYLTDYFGTNMPRWGMSHVDPIILLFVPIFFFFQHPLTLVFSQVVLVTASSLLVYKLAELHLKSKLAAFLLGLSFLFYPAVGYLTARTAFHGVTPAMFFFLGAFYLFEVMYQKQDYPRKGLVWFWVLLVITMSGKEQIPLYILFYGLFIWLYRGRRRLGLWVSGVALTWFVMAFFVIIPAFAHYRIEGYQKFADTMGIDPEYENEVTKSNYFLGRYADFGDTYLEVAIGMATHPAEVVRVFFKGDNVENFIETLGPVGFLPFASPATFIMSAPDFAFNYLTTTSGVGTAEIYNHRVSMIVPVVFISVVFAVKTISAFFSKRQSKVGFVHLSVGISVLILALNIYTSFEFNNPVYLWGTQAIKKRLSGKVFARTIDPEKVDLRTLSSGDRVDLPYLAERDRECSQKIVNLIPDGASVSGPDYLGAHLSMRETYAIFPALYDEADFVIVDVFAQKLSRILDTDFDFVGNTLENLILSDEHKMAAACGNLFVYANVGEYPKDSRLPLQERFEYEAAVDYELFDSLSVVDFYMPSQSRKGQEIPVGLVYRKSSGRSLDSFFLYLSFVHEESEELYQVANLPSLAFENPGDWSGGRYHIEEMEVLLPDFMPKGAYKVFVGISNRINTRNVYLGDIQVK